MELGDEFMLSLTFTNGSEQKIGSGYDKYYFEWYNAMHSTLISPQAMTVNTVLDIKCLEVMLF